MLLKYVLAQKAEKNNKKSKSNQKLKAATTTEYTLVFQFLCFSWAFKVCPTSPKEWAPQLPPHSKLSVAFRIQAKIAGNSPWLPWKEQYRFFFTCLVVLTLIFHNWILKGFTFFCRGALQVHYPPIKVIFNWTYF